MRSNSPKPFTFQEGTQRLEPQRELFRTPNQLQNRDEAGMKTSSFPIGQSMSIDNVSDSNLEDQFKEEDLNPTEIQENILFLEKMWEYRYTRLFDNAIKTGDWLRLFSFLGQFKTKAVKIVQELIDGGLSNFKEIDEIDTRYNMKKKGEDGIYFTEGIVIRIAKTGVGKDKKNTFEYNPVKALHQQFISCNIINNLAVSLASDSPKFPRIRVPLSCLVQYMGYTAFCQADCPCDGLQTLVHGPTGTIYQYRQEYVPLLQAIGKELNLKSFTILSTDKKSVKIPFSLTVELHKITTPVKQERLLTIVNPDSVLYPPNRKLTLNEPEYYLMNISKIWPLFIDSDIIKSVGYLRPEVVINSKSPLSNVVFSQISQKPDLEGQLELADACKKVKEDYIMNLAKMLDETTVFVVDSQGIQEIMHQYGINIRYLGSLAEKVSLQFNKKILQTEMIARVLKRFFYRSFHEMTQEEKKNSIDLHISYKECLADFLNLIFVRSKQGEGFWRNSIFLELKRYYDYTMKDYPPELQGGGIIHAICFHFNIRLKIIDYPFFQVLDTPPFNSSQVLGLHASSKTFDFDTSQIKQNCKHFKQKRKDNKISECITELKILATIYSLSTDYSNYNIAPLPQAYFYTELAEVYLSINDIELASQYAQLAVKNIPDKHSDAIRPYRVLMKCHSIRQESNKCIQYYEKSLNYLGYHLGQNHPISIEVYNTLAHQTLSSSDPGKCEKMFLRSLQICERSLGYNHMTSSQILLKLAGLPLSAQKKINYYLQGLTILENLQNNEQNRKRSIKTCMKVSEMYFELGNMQKTIYYAKKSGHWMMQILGQSRLAQHRNVLVTTNRAPNDFKELVFLFTSAFYSYMQLIETIPKNNIYKLFVSLKDHNISQTSAAERIFAKLRLDKSLMMTVTEFLRNTMTTLILEIPQLVQRPNFYLKLSAEINSNGKQTLESFQDIIVIIGNTKCEKALTELQKYT